MKDIQNFHDTRNIIIDRVGVSGLVMPLLIKQQNNFIQTVTAKIDMFIKLSANKKGTHMSRFVEIMEEFKHTPFDIKTAENILNTMQQQLVSNTSHLKVFFTYFVTKNSPISNKKASLNYKCKIIAISNDEDNRKKFTYLMKVWVPISLLCPCSKEISNNGAHNQRGIATVTINTNKHIFFEELIAILESSGSCEVYPILKRADEKFVTEEAYDNPKFVEDVVRELSLKLSNEKKFSAFKITCKSYESIHNHNAFAEINNHTIKSSS